MPVVGVTEGEIITEAWGDSVAAAVTALEAVMSTAPEKALLTELLGAIAAASGKVTGIEFPATQVPSADANTLDDYEEGTFIPAVSFGGAAAGPPTFSTQTGTYVKIGRLVFFALRITLTNNGTSTGAALITDLPIATALQAPVNITPIGGFSGLTGVLVGYVSGTTVVLRQTSATGSAAITDTQMTNTADVFVAGSYPV